MHIPGDVGFNRVHACVGQFLEGILPAIWVDSEIVESSGDELNGLVVEKIGILSDRKITGQHAGEKRQKKQQVRHKDSLRMLMQKHRSAKRPRFLPLSFRF